MNNSDTKTEAPTSLKRQLSGTVVSVSMNKTIVVSVRREFSHKLYKKILRRDKKYLVHNTLQDVSVGDKVRIIESKPLSKNKHFVTVEKL